MATAALEPTELATVSPLAAGALTRLLVAHPMVARRPEVGTAILAVTSRYLRQLRGAPDVVPITLDDAAVRRELMFLDNTRRPLDADPSTTAADLVAMARAVLSKVAVREAFDYTIALLVRRARRPLEI